MANEDLKGKLEALGVEYPKTAGRAKLEQLLDDKIIADREAIEAENARKAAEEAAAAEAEAAKQAENPPETEETGEISPETDEVVSDAQIEDSEAEIAAEEPAGRLYKNVTKRNIFTENGRISPGAVGFVADSDKANYPYPGLEPVEG